MYFHQLFVCLTFHVYRALPAHILGRGRSGQTIDVVVRSTSGGSEWSHTSSHGAGVAWRGGRTRPHETVAKTTGFGGTVPAVAEAIGVEANVAKTLPLVVAHKTRPVWIVL